MKWSFVNHRVDQGLIYKIYKEFMQFNSKKKKSNFKKGGRLEQAYFPRGHTNSQQVHEKVLNIINQQGSIKQKTQ